MTVNNRIIAGRGEKILLDLKFLQTEKPTESLPEHHFFWPRKTALNTSAKWTQTYFNRTVDVDLFARGILKKVNGSQLIAISYYSSILRAKLLL